MDYTAILLLSGFHYVDTDLGLTEKLSWLQTDESYYQRIENRINGRHEENEKYEKKDIKYLFILGDLSFSGEEEEFKKSESLLNVIIKEYSIKKENILILPGKNDIQRGELMQIMRDNKGSDHTLELINCQKEKLSSFQSFYNRFYSNTVDKHDRKPITFDPDRAICRVLYIDELDTVFLGINTLYKESYREQDHIGYINKAALAKELEDINGLYLGKKIVVLSHHKPFGMGVSKDDEIENWNECKPVFDKYHISSFISGGNVKSRGQRIIQSDTNEYCAIGELSPCDDNFDKRFSIMHYNEKGHNRFLSILNYQYIINNGDSGTFWQLMQDPDSLGEIIIKPITGSEAVNKRLSDIPNEQTPVESVPVTTPKKRARQHIDERSAKEFILSVIKEQNLYKLGYFRWSPKGESISYILMDYFFENYKSIEIIKAYYNVIMSYRNIDPELIIGYEMNGNMIGTLLAIEHECDYTYLPADDKIHIDPERELPTKEYKRIAVFLDLVFTKHLITRISKKIKESYPSVEKIYYVTLIEGTRAIIKEIHDEKGNKIEGPIIEIISFTNGNLLKIKDVENIEIYAYSICKIPMITTPFSQANNEFFEKQIIPEYHLFTSEL